MGMLSGGRPLNLDGSVQREGMKMMTERNGRGSLLGTRVTNADGV